MSLSRVGDTTAGAFILVGATGASGLELMQQLLEDSRCTQLLILSRREPNLDSFAGLKQKVSFLSLDRDSLQRNGALFQGYQYLLSALGTTRRAEPRASQFRAVDLELNFEIAVQARRAGVQHLGVISSKGAHSGLPKVSWRWLHPFLYLQTKGELEDRLKRLDFPSLSFFRPGLLYRHKGEQRSGERLARAIFSSLSTADLAKTMIADAFASSSAGFQRTDSVKIFEDADCRERDAS